MTAMLPPDFVTSKNGVRSNLPVGDATWRWVNEDFNTPDRVPYVGAPSEEAKGLYIATGFNGWGTAPSR